MTWRPLTKRTEYQVVLCRRPGGFRYVLRRYRTRRIAEREKKRMWQKYKWRWLKVEFVIVLSDAP